MFKHHCFPKSIILQAVYFKLRFSLSYRDVEELMEIRGVKVDQVFGEAYHWLKLKTILLTCSKKST
jgi:putative transposase